MIRTETGRTATQRRGSAATLRRRALGAMLLGLTACADGLLDVTNPGSVQESDLSNPALAQTLVNSALGQFECALTSYVASTGMLANEYVNASSWLDINGWGWRGIELYTITGACPGGRDATGLGAYTALQQARYLSESGIQRIEQYPADAVTDRDGKLARLAAYAGYSYVLLGEGYCEMAVDQGPLMTPAEVLGVAEDRFTTAIGHATAAGSDDLLHLALLGRARARLDLGDLAGAAADAEQIPADFLWNAEYSTVDGRRENRLFNLNRRNRYISVNPVDYGNVLLENGEPDPRVPTSSSGLKGHDGATDHWYQLKYDSPDAPIPMASWAEAQLIIAEARPEQAVTVLNGLRAAQGLPPVEPNGRSPLEIVLEERRRQLFSEGHRLNDMLRHDLPFPQGTNHKGQAYGPITCMPLPDQERQNNPNLPPR